MSTPQGSGSPRRTVGFVGLGDIGGPMAEHLAREFDLMVYDVRPDAMRPFRDRGVRTAASWRELVAFAESIHICVPYDDDVLGLVDASGGVLDHGRAGQILVIHSTVLPTTVQHISQVVASAGIDVVDAPVSGGGRDAATEGGLTVMVGADASALARVMPMLRTFGRRIVHVGPCGSGQAAKLANNIMSHCNRLAYLEAVTFAASFGITEAALQEVVDHSSGRSWVQENIGLVDLHGTRHTMAGTAEHPYRFAKDLRYAVEAAHRAGVAVPIAALAAHLAPAMYRYRWDSMRTARRPKFD